MRRKIIFLFYLLFFLSSTGYTADEQPLNIQDFIKLAAQNDTEFESILTEELKLAYQKDLNLPADDWLLEVKGEYDFMTGMDREDAETSFSLSRLFPRTGTEFSAEYSVTPSYTSTDASSSTTFTLSQPIAQNAFGKATRLHDKILGMEIDIARFQVVEAYEDYMAEVILAYYDWYEAYENLKIGESSYQENLKLLENMKERAKNSIALPIDINKTHLQVLNKKQKLIMLQEAYDNAANTVKRIIRRNNSDVKLIPQKPELYTFPDEPFEPTYDHFAKESRTYKIIELLDNKTALDVNRYADALLPSISLFAGYNQKGKDWPVHEEDQMIFAGISITALFDNQVNKAEYETKKVEEKITRLNNMSLKESLYTDIRNLFLSVDYENKRLAITAEQVALAESILNDETENYSYGKVSLNDYILAVNDLDSSRFDHISRQMTRKRLIIEWLRLTDQLIRKINVPAFSK